MKMKFILFLLLLVNNFCYSQYIGVKAKYIETKLIDDSHNPSKWENRLILSFFSVSSTGLYTPTSLFNYPMYINKSGLQYEVERSPDGASLQPIATVLSIRNNGGRADNRFISVQPDFRDYYRVKAIETTSNFFYSPIINFTKTNKPQFFVVNPNPVTYYQFTFRLTNAKQGRYVFSILNPQGQQIKQKLFTHNGGNISRQVDITGLPPTVYRYVLWSATERYSQKTINVY